MTRGRRTLAFLSLALLVGRPSAPQAQRQRPTFASGVELITVDAVVLDAEGHPVAGLGADDFVVSEDGRPREIASFEAFAVEAAPSAEAPSPKVASNEPGARAGGRAYAMLLDDLGFTAGRAETAREAAASFLQSSARPGDEVMVATTSGDVAWSARLPEGREDLLAVLSRVKGRYVDVPAFDRMTEYEAFRIVHYEDSPGTTQAGPGPQVSIPERAALRSDPPIPGFGVKPRVITRWLRASLCAPANCDQMVRGRAGDIDAQRRGRVALTFEAARRQLAALGLVRGRKSLLLFSEGFVDDRSSELHEVILASREANTALYFLDVRGLLGTVGFGSAADPTALPEVTESNTMALEETTLASAGSVELADATGGFSVRNSNDLAAGVERIAEESRVFYLLGFYPPEGKSTRDWRKLRVEVKRPGLRVRARSGYTLRAAAPPPPRTGKKKKRKSDEVFPPAVASALDSPHHATGIPLRAMAYVFEPRPKETSHVLVAVELDASRLVLQQKDKARVARVDVSVVAVNRDSGRGFRHDDTTDILVQGDAPPGWRGLTREFELPPGVTQARVVVRDAVSGAVGSVTQRFEVPPLGLLRLSTPILTDRVEPAKQGQAGPQPLLAVYRLFPPGGGLYVQFEVLGAARPPDGGTPRASAGFEVWTADGRLVRKVEPTQVATDKDGRLIRLLGMSTDGLREGAYDLVLIVEDAVSGARLRQREPFALGREVASGPVPGQP